MNYIKGMTCPVCEVGKLGVTKKDFEFKYKGHSRTYSSDKVFICSECESSFLNKKDQRNLDFILTNSRKEIDGLLTSDDIKAIRSIFKITQKDFAKLLGVGEKNFAKYESGQATQSRAMDILLRIFRAFPFTIEVVGGQLPVIGEKTEFKLVANRYPNEGQIAVNLKAEKGCSISEEVDDAASF